MLGTAQFDSVGIAIHSPNLLFFLVVFYKLLSIFGQYYAPNKNNFKIGAYGPVLLTRTRTNFDHSNHRLHHEPIMSQSWLLSESYCFHWFNKENIYVEKVGYIKG